MSPPRIGDVMKVGELPTDSHGHRAGLSGRVVIVQRIDDRPALVQAITLSGRAGPMAYVDIDQLEDVDDRSWDSAARQYQQRYDQALQEWAQARWLALQHLVERYCLGVPQLVEIAEAVNETPQFLFPRGDPK